MLAAAENQGMHLAHPNNLDAGPSRDTQKDEDVLAGYEADTYGQLLDVTGEWDDMSDSPAGKAHQLCM